MDFAQRGEIWLVSLDPVIGSEIGKTRPAVIISNNRNNEFAGTVTIIPVSSKTDRIYPFETYLPQEDTNLPKDSKAKCNQIRTIDKERLVKFKGSVPEGQMILFEQALMIHLGITYGDLE